MIGWSTQLVYFHFAKQSSTKPVATAAKPSDQSTGTRHDDHHNNDNNHTDSGQSLGGRVLNIIGRGRFLFVLKETATAQGSYLGARECHAERQEEKEERGCFGFHVYGVVCGWFARRKSDRKNKRLLSMPTCEKL
mmetsp:Transcript_8466/g.17034  ORF Transcript_8466/g.17034 Transcript_8466/m.17034 type:complete len:135 (+) Transcript_8466:117-521(+)|eukprot:scaffold4510_cov183-Amphora_coffeaeformis.AAC.8